MDGDWEEVSRLLLPPSQHGQGPIHTPIRAMAFDTHQELLWLGNDFGRLSSFYNSDLQPYTSFIAGDGPVCQVLFHDKGVIALTPTGIHMAMRRGPPIWHITHDDMKDLRCMSYTARGTSEILVAGGQNAMFLVDAEKGTVVRQITTVDHYTMMKRCRYICAATTLGSVNILDPKTFKTIKVWQAHSASVSDMDAQHDFVVTCGCSRRQQQTAYMNDPFVNVFNLKTLESFTPISFPSGAAYVRMHPKMSSTTIVASQLGQMHVVDLMNANANSNVIKQANVIYSMNGLDISPSGEALILSDSECQAHLWGNRSKIHFTDLSLPVEFADIEDHSQQMDWKGDLPLSTIGMPYYREILLSAWPSHMIFEIGAPPPTIDPFILSTLKQSGGYGYTQNPKNIRRNQVENTRTAAKASASIQAPMFLSDKENAKLKRFASQGGERRISDVADAIGAAELSSLKAEVPIMYRNVEIKYSKFGVDDFDFGYYNKTQYSGLETHISNSYANSLLQVMRFTPLIRNLALNHTATTCINDLCLLCELGFLVDMLEKATGSTCQATNMLKTFGYHVQAGALGLLEESRRPESSLTKRLQDLNRFLLERFSVDYVRSQPHSSGFDDIFATIATSFIKCDQCKSEHTKPGTTWVNELIYPVPPKTPARHNRMPKQQFSQILKLSVERETKIRGWCVRCQKHQLLLTTKRVHSAPAVLMLNAAANSPEAKQFWSTPGWLPEEIGIIIDNGKFYCYEGEDLKLHLLRNPDRVTVYSLIGIVADIDSGQHQMPHLVSLVNVAHAQPQSSADSQWHLFNDFLVRPIKSHDALIFNTTWKMPSVITYQAKKACNKIDDGWKKTMDCSILYRNINTSTMAPAGATYRSLVDSFEAPGEGTIIALDTEFVSVRQPEIQMNSDGVRETIRPTVYALARVSILRGSGEHEGDPFIDDYIAVKEKIVDYLTQFSGIVAGDLDPRTSRHNLVSLKVAYKKLWILLNLGCKFLGHGLKMDFRVANVHIPKAQRIDTNELFKPTNEKRSLSLAFLSYAALGGDRIQVETHDSIEDARTALRLYRKYQEYTDAGILEARLEQIYQLGKDLGYKPPPKRISGVINRSETPPMSDAGHSDMGASPGPVTPVRRPLGLMPGSATSDLLPSVFTPRKGSPFL